jgi:hypothetical protein
VEFGKTTPLILGAVGEFHAIEQDDLTQAEFNLLRTEHQRFMPLLGRFSTAHNTTLRIGTGSQTVTKDFAVTRLFAVATDGREVEQNSLPYEFANLVRDRGIASFRVEVLFNQRRAARPHSPGTISSIGTFLQAFTHEMSVHAEHMLDFIEQYWAYHAGTGGIPAGLGSPTDEHTAFKVGRVTRYEYMSARARPCRTQHSVVTSPDARGTTKRRRSEAAKSSDFELISCLRERRDSRKNDGKV